MKKHKYFNAINNQEDEDSSTYPLYPAIEHVYHKAKNKDGLSLDVNTGIDHPDMKMREWHDRDSLGSVGVPSSGSNDKNKKS